MRMLLIMVIAASAITPALAQHTGHSMPMPETMQEPEKTPAPTSDSHAGHDMGAPTGPAQTSPEFPPPAALDGPAHAADTVFDPAVMTAARDQLRAGHGLMKTSRVIINRMEARIHEGQDGYGWDAQGWYGGDINRLWIKTEGQGSFGQKVEEAEMQALWSRAFTPWFDYQAGVRYDQEPHPRRGYAVFGIQGLAPYFFELDAAAFLSNEGEVSARFDAEYDLLLTQRLILQPAFEVNLAAQDVEERGIGSGINDVELGLRLRYEIRREFAPYIGVNWQRKLGQTADIARGNGEDIDVPSLVAGVRFWF